MYMNIEDIKNNLNRLIEAEDSRVFSSRTFLVFNRQEWLMNPLIKFTEEELDNADDVGFIATKGGVDCYLARKVEAI